MSVDTRMAKAFGLEGDSWQRHANPWSVYPRIPIPPLLAAAVWSRSPGSSSGWPSSTTTSRPPDDRPPWSSRRPRPGTRPAGEVRWAAARTPRP
ncbi:MAG TPA: DUF6653 family protein [Blastococcus sp.]|nr:DUF6653 family protein [Blastococcus sp.]